MLTRAGNAGSVAGMSNVLDDAKQQQIRALGRLGWTLSRIQEATGVRRETISGYLKAADIAVRSRGRPSESTSKPAISPRGVHRLGRFKTGHVRCGIHRLCPLKTGPPGWRCPPTWLRSRARAARRVRARASRIES
jgi:hypothetical protein